MNTTTAMNNLDWKPLPYTTALSSWDEETNSCEGTIKLVDTAGKYNFATNVVDIVVTRHIPKDDEWNDTRSDIQKRRGSWYSYSATVKGIDELGFDLSSTFQHQDLHGATDEIATLLTMELDHLVDDGFSPRINNAIQAAKLEAALVTLD